jgi:hypothetical protein
MLPLGLLMTIEDKARCVPDVELFREHSDDTGRDLARVGEKSAKIPNSSQLDGKSKPVVVATFAEDDLAIRIIEVKVALQLLHRGFPRKPTVALFLFRS